ncbi:hypothetical protein Dfulv_24135 [Dactylosporangium fulvum]|uniref:Uncharacterized protein n=1 Tax=Dactylosporangium fulvum TaxID=53359 RepID=A0ABY5WDW0_9ACTN|nr:hypothetical protein [Dactylosporangium fulvum]UWP87163.1 hypothetical protein Dfulv_24135 [Dactylosporangium fulvum]
MVSPVVADAVAPVVAGMVSPAVADGVSPVVADAVSPAVADAEQTVAGELRLLAMLLGAVLGTFVAWTSPGHQGEPRWVLFAVLAAVLGAASGEAFGFGAARWRDLGTVHRVRLYQVLHLVLASVAVAVGLVAATPYVLGEQGLTGRGVALSAIAICGALPSAATLGAVHRVARRPLAGTPGEQLNTLLSLRRLVSRLLNQLGLLVLLVTLVNGAATGWGADLPKVAVLFSGAVASFVVGVMYVPASTTLRRRSALFVDRYFPLSAVDLSQLVSAADDRAKLEKLLGIDQTTFGELRTGLVIVSPFVVSALAAVIPKF